MYKQFVMNAILAEGVKPTLAELERFEETPEGIDIDVGVSMTHFQGDHVRVIGGRHKGDTGLIIWVEENMIVLYRYDVRN